MSQNGNTATVRRLYAEIDKAQAMAPFDEVTAPGYRGYFGGLPAMDRDGMKAVGDAFFAACPGLTHTVEDVLEDGDRVAVRLTVRGTLSRPLTMPSGVLPPTGRTFSAEAINLLRFSDGALVEQRIAFDMLGFLQQVGAMPA
jgi:predicted ester cyclase